MDHFLLQKDGRAFKRKAETDGEKRPGKIRSYDTSYLNFGFTCITINGEIRPQCVVCGMTLANESLKPNKLKRHLETAHGLLVGKNTDFFARKLEGIIYQKDTVKNLVSTPTNALKASYQVAYHIAKNKKPFTDGEKVILPSILDMARTMLGEKAAEKFKMVPISDTTVCRRISDMSEDIHRQLTAHLKFSLFAWQLDEATDLSKEAHLIAYVRYCHKTVILEDFLFCKPIKGHATSAALFDILNEFLCSNDLNWDSCVGICTDGAPSMCGARAGLKAKVLKVAPHILWTHCMIHREALAVRNMDRELGEVLNSAVKIVNFIKAHPTRARLFAIVCAEMGAEHDGLLFHTEVRWLSRGKVLNRIFELRNEVRQFLVDMDPYKAEQLCNPRWLVLLAYLADIFDKLNSLNLSLQGAESTSFTMYKKTSAFKKKLELWRRLIQDGLLEAFPCLAEALEDTGYELESAAEVIINHLTSLRDSLEKYFPEETDHVNDWVFQPFLVGAGTRLPVHLQEDLIEVQSDRILQMQFNKISLGDFWLAISEEHSGLSKIAVKVLLPFSSSYLCEIGFSSLAVLKTKYRSRLEVEHNLRMAVARIHPQIDRLSGEKQAHPSH
ncbi:zinc finger BED domain-containing protein 5-like [Pleurodeles waltl]|uniref:zinc finger BED domain-containing protein 5-like n=1 Tax=Pleurodeles waltl TaxID=8319 RepID=UPI0037098CD5